LLNAGQKRSARWSAQQARKVIDAQVASGLSVHSFARREGIDAERVYRWKRRLTANTSVPTFVEVRAAGVVGKEQLIELALRSGHRLFFTDSVDPSALRQLLRVLE
jgi:transposase-like protein